MYIRIQRLIKSLITITTNLSAHLFRPFCCNVFRIATTVERYRNNYYSRNTIEFGKAHTKYGETNNSINTYYDRINLYFD